MVDTKQIKQLVLNNFQIWGTFSIDSEGLVSVYGDVGVKEKPMNQLPVKFAKVTGHFFCEKRGLLTLQGCPKWVGGSFWAQYNKLTSLEGAPEHVGQNFQVFANKLTNLMHAPPHVGGEFMCYVNPLTSLEGIPELGLKKLVISYDRSLPLLRCLVAQSVDMGHDAPDQVNEIIQRYAGHGKKGALACAAELIKGGYKGNARW